MALSANRNLGLEVADVREARSNSPKLAGQCRKDDVSRLVTRCGGNLRLSNLLADVQTLVRGAHECLTRDLSHLEINSDRIPKTTRMAAAFHFHGELEPLAAPTSIGLSILPATGSCRSLNTVVLGLSSVG